VDPRRANLSQEPIAVNVERLKAYRARLILFPRKSGQHKTLDASKEDVKAAQEEHGKIIKHLGKVLPIENVSRAAAVGEVKRSEMGEGTKDAYRTLRLARSDARLVGVREKRAKTKADEATAAKK
jgi:large subunit ribosomal protein L13e